jgi:hypothetical protein
MEGRVEEDRRGGGLDRRVPALNAHRYARLGPREQWSAAKTRTFVIAIPRVTQGATHRSRCRSEAGRNSTC